MELENNYYAKFMRAFKWVKNERVALKRVKIQFIEEKKS